MLEDFGESVVANRVLRGDYTKLIPSEGGLLNAKEPSTYMKVPFLKEQSYERKLSRDPPSAWHEFPWTIRGYTFLHLGGQEYLSLVKKK